MVEEVGAPVADALSTCPPAAIRFKQIFNAFEAEEEQSSALATVLDVLRTRYPSGFKAANLVGFVGSANEEAINFKAALEMACGKALPNITATALTARLRALKEAPVLVDGVTLALRYSPDSERGGSFTVAVAR